MRHPKLPKAVRALSSGALAGGVMTSAGARKIRALRAQLELAVCADGLRHLPVTVTLDKAGRRVVVQEVPPWRTGRA